MLRRALRLLRDRLSIARDPVTFARRLGVTVGHGCRFLGTDRGTFGSEPYLITIGNHVTITAGVQFITHDGGVWVLRESFPDLDVVGAISVGDNVFVGAASIVLPGVTIGSDVVIGAGSVVTKDVAPGTVVAGVPARRICSVDDYAARALERGVHFRSLPPQEKRAAFLRHVAEQKQGIPPAGGLEGQQS